MSMHMSPLTSGTRIASGLLSVVLLAAPLAAQTTGAPPAAAAGLSGHWEGPIQAPGAQVGVEIGITGNEAGALAGKISLITQKGAAVALEFTAVGGLFNGSVNADGTGLTGTFTQGPGALALTFRRAAGAQ